MTNEEADAEAQRRWGKYAGVYFASQSLSDGEGGYSVYSDIRNSSDEGFGKTWEEAFANADKRPKKQGKLL